MTDNRCAYGQTSKKYTNQSTIKKVKYKQIENHNYFGELVSLRLSIFHRTANWSNPESGNQKLINYKKKKKSFDPKIFLLNTQGDTIKILRTDIKGQLRLSLSSIENEKIVISKQGYYPVEIGLKKYARNAVHLKIILIGKNYGGIRKTPVRKTIFKQ